MSRTIRLATTADAPAIQAIYSPIVRETAISFEVEPPSVEEMRHRIASILAVHPWLVCEEGGTLQGYAYASRHRERAAYQWSVDVSVYVHAHWRGQRVGQALYTALFAILRTLGYHNVYAGIALPNPASVALHEAMGMELVGVYRHTGYKLGRWHDVGWWQGVLQSSPPHPLPPRAIGDMRHAVEWESPLTSGLAARAE
jgi:phosphinothricin acetyltransferase